MADFDPTQDDPLETSVQRALRHAYGRPMTFPDGDGESTVYRGLAAQQAKADAAYRKQFPDGPFLGDLTWDPDNPKGWCRRTPEVEAKQKAKIAARGNFDE